MLKSLPSVLRKTPGIVQGLALRPFSLRSGIYAGSFDPPSSGHLDIIRRGTSLCDKLYVGIAVNTAKR